MTGIKKNAISKVYKQLYIYIIEKYLTLIGFYQYFVGLVE